MVKDGGWITCMDAISGEVYYQEKIMATPAIAGKNVYVRTSEYLYAFKD